MQYGQIIGGVDALQRLPASRSVDRPPAPSQVDKVVLEPPTPRYQLGRLSLCGLAPSGPIPSLLECQPAPRQGERVPQPVPCARAIAAADCLDQVEDPA